MNEQAIKEIRNRKASLHNCEGLEKLKEASNIIWEDVRYIPEGGFFYYFTNNLGVWGFSDYDPFPKSYTPSEVLREQQELTEQELLEEAKRRYPVGTKFVDFEGIKYEASCDPWLLFRKKIVVREAGEGGVCYHEGKWAEIIEQPNYSFEKTRAKNLITEIKAKTKELETIFNKLYSNNGNKS